MPKATSGPKAIANAWKAKGLQKLRFYCQLCQKQCRDANGFKCHVASESHRRQASLFASNPSSFMDDWSKEFEAGFTKLLSRRFGTREVRANGVYNEYIQDRHHVHMNATMWESLTAFVKYLGRTGKCRVREDERGWWLAWVDHSDDAKRREEAKAKALARERRGESKRAQELADLAASAAAAAGGGKGTAAAATALAEGGQGGGALTLTLPSAAPASASAAPAAAQGQPMAPVAAAGFGEEEEEEDVDVAPPPPPSRASRWGRGGATPAASSGSSLQIASRPPAQRAQEKPEEGGSAPPPPSTPSWLMRGIIVKILSKSLEGGAWYKAKGTVVGVVPGQGGAPPSAKVRVLRPTGGKACLVVPLPKLESVVPRPGGVVALVAGPHKGRLAKVTALHQDKFCATLQCMGGGPGEGGAPPPTLHHQEYDWFSKWDVPWATKHGVKPAA